MGTYLYILTEHRDPGGLWAPASIVYPCPTCASTPGRYCDPKHEPGYRNGMRCGYEVPKHYALHSALCSDHWRDSDEPPLPPVISKVLRGLPPDASPDVQAIAHEEQYSWPRARQEHFEKLYGESCLGSCWSGNGSWLSMRELLAFDFLQHVPGSEDFVMFLKAMRSAFPTEADLDNTRIIFGYG